MDKAFRCVFNCTFALLKGIVSVYIAKFSNGSRKGIPNKQSSAWVSHFVTSGSMNIQLPQSMHNSIMLARSQERDSNEPIAVHTLC